MKFKIDLDIPKCYIANEWPNFFSIGSCFAQNQSVRLAKAGFKVYSNPFGIIYNPVSISSILYRLAQDRLYTSKDFIQDGVFSLEHHGNYSYQSIDQAIAKSNELLATSKAALAKSDVVIITLGTSIVFHNLQYQKIAANCHKLPGNQFQKLQLHYKAVVNSVENCIKDIRKLNANAEIIFTVSPIRHLKSGVIQNSRSKANLLAALHEVLEKTDRTYYFPSYEIFMDELRDYRFAKDDLAHPTQQAEEYIWGKFKETVFTPKINNTIDEVEKFRKFEEHIPLSKDNNHKAEIETKRKMLISKYPELSL